MKKLIILFVACFVVSCSTVSLYQPEIGSKIDNKYALILAEKFELNHVLNTINNNPDYFRPWYFDGCSGFPDIIMGNHWKDITYNCCLPHDLEYAYGKFNDEVNRLAADMRFFNNLIDVGVDPKIAKLFYKAVRYGGKEYGLTFSWGFARKQ